MGAPKGNKFAIGNNGGRPPKYENVEDIIQKIDEYFNSGLKKRKILIGRVPNQIEIEVPVPTITGLAYYLGFESRQSFYDYGKRKEFSYIIKRARLFIEVEYEEQLQYGNVTGAIFALKNMGWEDKLTHDVNEEIIGKINSVLERAVELAESVGGISGA